MLDGSSCTLRKILLVGWSYVDLRFLVELDPWCELVLPWTIPSQELAGHHLELDLGQRSC